mmetsp:Transcript_6292/g.16046  ORF Transcript_6292/g.16046 Transcript_6292/m.16046 type:complete len:212 (-) Transcript_6292:1241-1876(-)
MGRPIAAVAARRARCSMERSAMPEAAWTRDPHRSSSCTTAGKASPSASPPGRCRSRTSHTVSILCGSGLRATAILEWISARSLLGAMAGFVKIFPSWTTSWRAKSKKTRCNVAAGLHSWPRHSSALPQPRRSMESEIWVRHWKSLADLRASCCSSACSCRSWRRFNACVDKQCSVTSPVSSEKQVTSSCWPKLMRNQWRSMHPSVPFARVE